jgi:hypothetical protein
MDYRAIKIRSTTFFGGEVKLSAPVVIFYGMLKNPAEYARDRVDGKNKRTFLAKFPSVSLLGYCWYLAESSGG